MRLFFIRHVGVLVIVSQFKLEKMTPVAFFFMSPIQRNSSGNGRDYQDAFCLSKSNLFSLCIHVGQRKSHFCLEFLKVFFRQMIQGEKYLTCQIHLVHSHWRDRTPFFLLHYTQENFCNFCHKETQLMCRDSKNLLLDNQIFVKNPNKVKCQVVANSPLIVIWAFKDQLITAHYI